MQKLVPVLLGIVVISFGFVFFKNFEISGVDDLKVVPREAGMFGDRMVSKKHPFAGDQEELMVRSRARVSKQQIKREVQGRRAIRIASFNVDALNNTKAKKLHVIDVLARIVREFDIIALQEIQSDTDDLVPRLTDLVNRFGANYDFIVGPRLGPVGMLEQYAFIFNQDVSEVDRTEIYTIDDRDDLMMREPLVTWFRVKGVPKKDAFTFSLVNVHIDARRANVELELLDDIISEVRRDGREEDDVILLGDFGASSEKIGNRIQLTDLGFGVVHLPTTTDGKLSSDNLVFQKTPTTEFTGRSGVLDFLREYNLSIDQALEVSDHLPVWAEFSLFEGGEPGRVAMSKNEQPE